MDTKLRTLPMVLVASACFALTPAHDTLRSLLRSLVRTTAMIAFIGKFGRITAWGYSSYSYWFRNYGCTGGFCGGSSGFMELYWFGFRNLIYLG